MYIYGDIDFICTAQQASLIYHPPVWPPSPPAVDPLLLYVLPRYMDHELHDVR